MSMLSSKFLGSDWSNPAFEAKIVHTTPGTGTQMAMLV
jgi:hypothetical protein